MAPKTINATAVAAAASPKRAAKTSSGKRAAKTSGKRKTGARASGASSHMKSLALNYGTVAGTAALASGLIAYRVQRAEPWSVGGLDARLIAGAAGLGLNYWKPSEKWAHYAKLVGLGSLISWASNWGEDQGAAMGAKSKGVSPAAIEKAKEEGAQEPQADGSVEGIIGAVGVLGGKRALQRRERRLEKKINKIEAKQALRADTARRGKPANSQMVRVPAFAVKPEYASRYGI